MKKVLLTSTALVAFAGAASAEITLSGWAEMGITKNETSYDNHATSIGGEWMFHTDLDIDFALRGETDNGIEYGADIDLDEAQFASNGPTDNSVFISGAFGKITMGDTDGAFDKAMVETAAGGTIDDAPELSWFDFNGEDSRSSAVGAGNAGLDGANNGHIMRYDYTFSGFTGSFSVELDDGLVDAAGNGTSAIWGLGVNYDAELAGFDLAIGMGYQKGDIMMQDYSTGVGGRIGDDGTGTKSVRDASVWGISVGTDVAGFGIGLNYSQTDVGNVNDQEYTGASLSYNINGIDVGVNYGKMDSARGIGGADATAYGAWAGYEIGEGVNLVAGYGKVDGKANLSGLDVEKLSLGLSLAF